jgi:hypothetical protein
VKQGIERNLRKLRSRGAWARPKAFEEEFLAWNKHLIFNNLKWNWGAFCTGGTRSQKTKRVGSQPASFV